MISKTQFLLHILQLAVRKEMATVYSENQIKHINAFCGEIAEFLVLKCVITIQLATTGR
jgi:hypothetical protein